MDRPFDIIATRAIEVIDDLGHRVRQVFVHIGRPWQEPTGEWALPYQIVGLGKGKVYRVLAYDAIQALQGVQVVIGGLLAGFDEAEQGRLRWDGDPDLGFPIPPVSTSNVESARVVRDAGFDAMDALNHILRKLEGRLSAGEGRDLRRAVARAMDEIMTSLVNPALHAFPELEEDEQRWGKIATEHARHRVAESAKDRNGEDADD